MKSARAAIAFTALFLVLLPFLLLLVAWTYERAIVLSYERELSELADHVVSLPVEQWNDVARRERVWLRRVGPSGEHRSGFAEQATVNSFIGVIVEGALSIFGADTPFESLQDIESVSLATRPEVEAAQAGEPSITVRTSESGQTVVVTVARPLGHGNALLVQRATHRGIRQLLLARRQLGKLVFYQVIFAVAAVFLLSRWLVKPLEQLTGRARKYPTQAIADPGLVERLDEIGQLTRAFSALTHSLEERRHETVRLAADIAHELKNPLATIAAASELIAHTVDASPAKRTHVHAVITEAVERLRATTESLLSLVKLESVLSTAPRDRLEYGPWLHALLDSYRSDPQHEGWRFELAVQGAPVAWVVAEAWASLLRNLIDNARVQPSTQRLVRVQASVENGQLVTEVKDFGPGVSDGNREKIFGRFFTARPDGAPRGTGLGLAIVATVAQAHQGQVELLPAVANEGATFRVSIRHLVGAAMPLPHGVLEQSMPRS